MRIWRSYRLCIPFIGVAMLLLGNAWFNVVELPAPFYSRVHGVTENLNKPRGWTPRPAMLQSADVTQHGSNTTGLETRLFIEKSYRNALAQYNKGIEKPSRAHLESLPRHGLSNSLGKLTSKCNVKSLGMDYNVRAYEDRLEFTVKVSSKQGSPVSGCSFLASGVFEVGEGKRKTLCNSYDWFNGSYSIVCVNPAVSDCMSVSVKVLYCAFEAYKRTKLHNRVLVHDRFCFSNISHTSSGYNSVQQDTVVSWSLDARNKCKNLFFNNVLQKPLDASEVCDCVDRYDRLYLVGTSHIGEFSDYVMHTCEGLDMTGRVRGLKHGNLRTGNVYFEDGRYSQDLYEKLQRELDSWLHNSSRVAICIQTGSWDLYRIGITFALEVALDYYEKLIVYVKSRIEKSPSKVDFHIVATPPRPDGHVIDRITNSAFDMKLQLLAEKHGVSFINAFAVLDPCANDPPPLAGNTHHYLQGKDNTWEGTAGKVFYRGVFLPTLCPRR